ncbi:SUMF1/EgtB/PvdO family nonheme iron enzyme [Desulfosarcina sp. OttesenSCG-928-A07]|nr:SUMF1/EgtB/PvdO family nonheme iron enzyme [Desulfosarcina sp. OttesenSCG-928-G17]MDL2328375.1 SUMF1/EgtB/PvdO family nonheme iron enzyme [Desulfosarcina sp. OttesenSCG-928-A07]
MSTIPIEALVRMFNPDYESIEERELAKIIRYLDGNTIRVGKTYNRLTHLQVHEIKLNLDLLGKIVEIGEPPYPTVLHYIAGPENTEIKSSSTEPLNKADIITKWYGFDLDDWQQLLPLAENPMLYHSTFLLQLLKTAIEGLYALYSVKFIHCDIKKDNLCLAVELPKCIQTKTHWQGTLDPSRLKIIDLGLCFRSGSKDLHSLPDLRNFSLSKEGRCERVKAAFGLMATKKDTELLSKLDWRVDCYDMSRVFKHFLEIAQKSPRDLHGPYKHSICFKKLVNQMEQTGKSIDETKDQGSKNTGDVPNQPYLGWLAEIRKTFSDVPPQQQQWPFLAPKDPATYIPSERNAGITVVPSEYGESFEQGKKALAEIERQREAADAEYRSILLQITNAEAEIENLLARKQSADADLQAADDLKEATQAKIQELLERKRNAEELLRRMEKRINSTRSVKKRYLVGFLTLICCVAFYWLTEGNRAETAQPQPPRKPDVVSVPVVPLKTHTNSIGVEFVLIPASVRPFNMGSNEENDEKPIHPVTISKPFYLGKYEVTQAQWEAVMGGESNKSKFKGPNNPVEMVSWDDVKFFIRKLNEKESTSKYRLPTEAEWEYAARAGGETAYCFGDHVSQLEKYAWYGEDWNKGSTHAVGQKSPNTWGLYDMHGNVWEWVEDWYGGRYYHNSPSTDPKGPPSGDYGVLRGGSWCSYAKHCRSANRSHGGPGNQYATRGFRLAFSPER